MKISEYPEVITTQPEDKFIVSTTDGTKSIKSENVRINGIPEEFTIVPFVEDPIVLHSSHFRGKNLGNEVTEEQIQAIQNGTFDDLWIGDYWEIGDNKWRIADIDLYITKIDHSHHIVLFPDNVILSASASTLGWSSSSTHLSPLLFDYLQKESTINASIPATIRNRMVKVEVRRNSGSINNSSTKLDISYNRTNASIFLPNFVNICESFVDFMALKLVAARGKFPFEKELSLFKLNNDTTIKRSNHPYILDLSLIDGSTMYQVIYATYNQFTLAQMSDMIYFRPLIIIGA